MSSRVHAFRDDALAEYDGVAIAELIRTGAVDAKEVVAAALRRLGLVEPELAAVVGAPLATPRFGSDPAAPLYGVPTFVKDNTDLAGLPTAHGSAAFVARPAARDGAYARQLLATGMTVLGKTRLPEFGFTPTTEFGTSVPARNPWNTEYSVGGSSGGSAALVAAGVVPIAHGNDGGGSIRIPAACAGLVGLKPSRHRHVDGELAGHLPINMISEGVLTRTVRDTAAYLAAAEDHWRSDSLPPIGSVHGPADRRLRVGLLVETIDGAPVDEPTRRAVARTAALLEDAGHLVEPIAWPVTDQFADDFLHYWGLLADLSCTAGKFTFDRSFDVQRTEPLTRGLREHHRRNVLRTPAVLRRLGRASRQYARMFAHHEVVLSPVLGHTVPKLGFISPDVPYPALIERLRAYVSFTPLQNIAGTPAISLPMGLSDEGLPIGVQLSGAYGDERTLLEVAYALEAAQPFVRIADTAEFARG